MEIAIQQYFDNICPPCLECTTFRINGLCLLINSNYLIIN